MSRLIFAAFGPFFGPFLGHFLYHFLDNLFWIILSGEGRLLVFRGGVGCSLSVLREGWEANCCYLGRVGLGSNGGVEDELLILREGWEVVVLENASYKCSF